MDSTQTRAVAAGATLWAVVIALPTVHLGIDALKDPWNLIGFLAPAFTLAWGTYTARSSVSLFVFPATLALATIYRPALMSQSVYGLSEFIVLIIATMVFLQSAMRNSVQTVEQTETHDLPPHTQTRLKGTMALLYLVFAAMLLVPLLSLHFDTTIRYQIAQTYGPDSALATTYIGLLIFGVWSVAVLRLLIRDFSKNLLTDYPFREEFDAFQNLQLDSRRVRSQLLWAIVAAAICAMLLIFSQYAGEGV